MLFPLRFLWRLAFVLTLSFQALSGQQPDTTIEPLRDCCRCGLLAHCQRRGLHLTLRGNIENGKTIYQAGAQPRLVLGLGKKILIWRGAYAYITIDGSECVNY
jgi:hypothetical protein